MFPIDLFPGVQLRTSGLHTFADIMHERQSDQTTMELWVENERRGEATVQHTSVGYTITVDVWYAEDVTLDVSGSATPEQLRCAIAYCFGKAEHVDRNRDE